MSTLQWKPHEGPLLEMGVKTGLRQVGLIVLNFCGPLLQRWIYNWFFVFKLSNDSFGDHICLLAYKIIAAHLNYLRILS